MMGNPQCGVVQNVNEINPVRPFVVRDPVHGYLSVAPHERLVVDTPITQRLRRICQTGLAEMVFPEAKTSRFVHSLGAMHLASRFVVTALENASQEDMQSFFDDISKWIDWTLLHSEELDELLQHSGALDALSAIRFSSFLAMDSSRGKENRRLLALIEGALRLAALFHDLGHLPFSHDLEYALGDYVSSKESHKRALSRATLQIANAKAPHEEIGHSLAEVVFQLMPGGSPAVRSVYSLANKILESPEPTTGLFKHQPTSALQWLHSLVDGEIDVDRADYLLRDGQALGLDFAQYDLDRLVANLMLVKTPELGYTTAIKEPGLAALESYCLTRSRSHQVFVRHHKVAQVGAALRYASTKLMTDSASDPLFDFLSELKTVSNKEEREDALRQYSVLDDGWWFQGLRKLQANPTTPLLSSCLSVVLDRGPRLKSLWKRKGDLSDEQFDLLKKRVKSLLSSESGKVGLQGAKQRLLEKGVLFTSFRFTPYAVDRASGESAMRIRSKNGELVSASKMSPLIRHLESLWQEDLHFYAFAEITNPISIDEVLDLLDSDGTQTNQSDK